MTQSQAIINDFNKCEFSVSYDNEVNGIQFFARKDGVFARYEDGEYRYYKNVVSWAKAVVAWQKRGY